jgi:hypothetical protein
MARPKNIGQLNVLMEDMFKQVGRTQQINTGLLREWGDFDLRRIPEEIVAVALRAGVSESVTMEHVEALKASFKRVEDGMLTVVDESSNLSADLGSSLHIVEAIRFKMQRARDSADGFTV